MRHYWLLFSILAGTPLWAQGPQSGFVELSVGSLQGAEPQQRFGVETDWSLGMVGLQIGANGASFGAENSTAAFRAILTRDLRWPVRLGLSVAYETDDGVWEDAITFGFHGRYRSNWSFFEANLLLPNHIRETGTFSFNIAGEQWLTPKSSIKTELYRLSTDLEDPDFYTISLTGSYAINDALTVFAQGFQTTSDDYDFKGNGTHLGVAYQFTPQAELRVSLDSLRSKNEDAAFGATLALNYDFGGNVDQGRMFQTSISPDRFGIGAFDTRL